MTVNLLPDEFDFDGPFPLLSRRLRLGEELPHITTERGDHGIKVQVDLADIAVGSLLCEPDREILLELLATARASNNAEAKKYKGSV